LAAGFLADNGAFLAAVGFFADATGLAGFDGFAGAADFFGLAGLATGDLAAGDVSPDFPAVDGGTEEEGSRFVEAAAATGDSMAGAGRRRAAPPGATCLATGFHDAGCFKATLLHGMPAASQRRRHVS